jgi:hypothetical protein
MRSAIAATSMATALFLWGAGARAQGAAAQHYDLNVYPVLTGSGPYDLNAAPVQSGPAGTVTMTSAAPQAAYSFKELLANTHGYVSTGVSSRGGYGFEGGVSMPIVPGRVELELGGGTGQIGGLPSLRGDGKHSKLTYDSYYADLHVRPTDDIEARIAISGLRLHGPDYAAPYGFYGAP